MRSDVGEAHTRSKRTTGGRGLRGAATGPVAAVLAASGDDRGELVFADPAMRDLLGHDTPDRAL
jgi:hypothetical protein